MENFVLFCKTYKNDLSRLINLLGSVKKHNRDNITLYISVPSSDFNLFATTIDTSIAHLLTDESITDQLALENVGDFPPGYINQEIVKLAFWKMGLSENYFCLDADSYFIRDFGYQDFMYNDVTPYSVLIEDKELCVDPDYRYHWNTRYEKLVAIKQAISYQNDRLVTCHGFTTLSSKVLRSFEEKFLNPNKYSLTDILEISPYEFSWYNFWLQKEKDIEIVSVEPLFKVFHYKKQYMESREKGITESDISRAYLGIVLNSNWNYDSEIVKYADPVKLSKALLKRYVRKLTNRILKLF